MSACLPNPTPSRTVLVNGQAYAWDPVAGLDPAAVVGLEGFVRSRAWAHRDWAAGVGLDLDDLQQEGYWGALKAAARFQPDRGTSFLTYASWWIEYAMREALGRRLVRTPEGHAPAWIGSLDQVMSPGEDAEGTPFLELEVDSAPSPLEESIEQEHRAKLRAAIQDLAPRAREVVLRHTGLGGATPEPLRAIADDLRISRQRASQILEGATRHLSLDLAS